MTDLQAAYDTTPARAIELENQRLFAESRQYQQCEQDRLECEADQRREIVHQKLANFVDEEVPHTPQQSREKRGFP